MLEAVDEHEYHVPDTRPRDWSGTALQTAIADRLFERDDLEDSSMSALARAENWQERDRR